jgi:hypothetical protein
MGAYDDLIAPTAPAGPRRNAYADLLPQPAVAAAAAPGSIAAPGSPNDPSAGGGEFYVGPWDTGLHTPQWLDRTLAGAGRGIEHGLRSVGNWAGLVPDSVLATEKETDKPLMATTAGQVGNLIGESALTAPIGMGAGAVVGRVAPWLAESAIGSGALQGALQGAVTADPGERAAAALTGGVTGGALGGLTSLGNKAIQGLTRSAAAQRLLDEGIDLTPGLMNPAGPMNQFEQASESIGGLRQIIEPARENAERQYQALVIGKGAAPGTTITPSANIHDMLQEAYNSYEPLYAQAKGFAVKPGVVQGPATTKLSYLFDQAAQAPGTTEQGQNAARSFLNNELTSLPANPTSTDLLRVRSNIRQAARTAKMATDTVATDKAAIYSLADRHVTAALDSQLPPDALAALRSADANYGNYKVIENAVAASKDNLAGLTPQKLSQAVYNATPDQPYALGAGGPLRDLAKTGGEVFQNVSPPTGARVLTIGTGLGAGLLGATHPLVGIPMIAAGTGMLGLTGTGTGRALAQGATRPQVAAQRLAQALSGNLSPQAQALAGQLVQRGATGALMPYTQQAAPAALAAALLLGSGAKQKAAETAQEVTQ